MKKFVQGQEEILHETRACITASAKSIIPELEMLHSKVAVLVAQCGDTGRIPVTKQHKVLLEAAVSISKAINHIQHLK